MFCYSGTREITTQKLYFLPERFRVVLDTQCLEHLSLEKALDIKGCALHFPAVLYLYRKSKQEDITVQDSNDWSVPKMAAFKQKGSRRLPIFIYITHHSSILFILLTATLVGQNSLRVSYFEVHTFQNQFRLWQKTLSWIVTKLYWPNFVIVTFLCLCNKVWRNWGKLNLMSYMMYLAKWISYSLSMARLWFLLLKENESPSSVQFVEDSPVFSSLFYLFSFICITFSYHKCMACCRFYCVSVLC